MKAKSINSMAAEEISRKLNSLLSDEFTPILAYIFHSKKEEIDGIMKLIHKDQVEIFGFCTSWQFTDWGIEKKEISVSVKDNGPGIPSSIVDKIFQPFFTTKPTGSGTGLGLSLSLSYDIVKAHGGEIRVESVEGDATEFIIQIPIS